MADEPRELILEQREGDALRVEHCGTLRVHGDAKADAMRHHAELVHATPADRPLVHMVLWDEQRSGKVTLTGDAAAPVHANFKHHFDNEHRQTHRFETALSSPVHHALQMRTPLQVRFCNSWQIASDYTIEIRLGDNRVIGVRLTGATVAKPLPCDDDVPCAPVVTHPLHP